MKKLLYVTVCFNLIYTMDEDIARTSPRYDEPAVYHVADDTGSISRMIAALEAEEAAAAEAGDTSSTGTSSSRRSSLIAQAENLLLEIQQKAPGVNEEDITQLKQAIEKAQKARTPHEQEEALSILEQLLQLLKTLLHQNVSTTSPDDQGKETPAAERSFTISPLSLTDRTIEPDSTALMQTIYEEVKQALHSNPNDYNDLADYENIDLSKNENLIQAVSELCDIIRNGTDEEKIKNIMSVIEKINTQLDPQLSPLGLQQLKEHIVTAIKDQDDLDLEHITSSKGMFIVKNKRYANFVFSSEEVIQQIAQMMIKNIF